MELVAVVTYGTEKKHPPQCCISCFPECAAEQPTKHMALLLFLYSPTHCFSLTPVEHRMLKVFYNESPTPVFYKLEVDPALGMIPEIF